MNNIQDNILKIKFFLQRIKSTQTNAMKMEKPNKAPENNRGLQALLMSTIPRFPSSYLGCPSINLRTDAEDPPSKEDP